MGETLAVNHVVSNQDDAQGEKEEAAREQPKKTEQPPKVKRGEVSICDTLWRNSILVVHPLFNHFPFGIELVIMVIISHSTSEWNKYDLDLPIPGKD